MNIKYINGVQLCEYESLSNDVRKVLKSLDNPQIKLFEVWIIPDEESDPEVKVKYGYYLHPSRVFITILNKDDRIKINVDSISLPDSHYRTTDLTGKGNSVSEQVIEDKPTKRSFFDDMFDDSDEESSGFLDNVLHTNENESILKALVRPDLECKAESCRKYLDDTKPYRSTSGLTSEVLYNILTSARHHKSIAYLNACKCDHGATSYIRMSELQKLFDFKMPSMGMENFAIDLGSTIIYFHMDTNRGGFDNVHFNRYLYNDIAKGEMKFFNKTNSYAPIDYEEWEEKLSDKTVLVFGCNQSKLIDADLPLENTEPPLVFLGCHESIAIPIDEGFGLNLCHSYDLPA